MSGLRTVDISGQAPVNREGVGAGAVPELRWLSIADLVIDDRFQRPLERSNWAAIRRIAQDFNWGKFAAVVASPLVGGKYSLIDGQHRAHGAALAGFDAVPAMIVVLSDRDQAASFAAINGNVTAMSAYHVYRAALAAEEGWAVRSRDAVAHAGCDLMTFSPTAVSRKARDVYCIATIRRHVVAGRAEVVTAALRALADHPGATADHFGASVIDPWIGALVRGGARLIRADLTEFCARHDLARVRDQIIAISKQPEYRNRTVRDLTEAAYVALLNKWLGPENLPVVAGGTEAAVGARMAAVAAGERKAHLRRGMA